MYWRMPRLFVGWLMLAVIATWLTGCAQPQPKGDTEDDGWSGRLALQVEGQASQSFSAIFELRGNERSGGLVLISPLGSRLAQLDWSAGYAELVSSQETRRSDSLEALLQDVTGTRIPVAALFSWLRGTQATAPGWRADLSSLPEGRITAYRDDPAPQATLRIALTR